LNVEETFLQLNILAKLGKALGAIGPIMIFYTILGFRVIPI
jgi:hypothetical protein